ncbi:MAG: hypothetical protein ABNG96_02010, partial [Flavobacterium sp.]
MKNFLLIISILLFNVSFSQGTSCATADPFCSGDQALIFPNTTGQPDSSQIACLGSQPNGTWFYLQVENPGLLEFDIVQNTAFNGAGNPTGTGLDVDYVAWGPFNPGDNYCSLIDMGDCPTCPNNTTNPNFYPFGNIVDCSYSGAAIETLTINNALPNQIYVVLITNFDGDPGFIKLVQTNSSNAGAGSTNCDIVCGISLGPDQLYCSTVINNTNITATFNQAPTVAGTPTYQWYLDTGSGPVLQPAYTTATINVNQAGTWSVVSTRPGCSDQATDEVVIAFASPPVLNQPANIVDSSGSCNPTFDLTSVIAAMVSPGNPANYNVLFYLDVVDSWDGNANNINPANAFQTSVTTTIYVRVEDINNPTCAEFIEFDVVVSCAVAPVQPSDMIVCDDASNDGFETFDLTTQDVTVLGVNSAANYTVTYHTTAAGASDPAGNGVAQATPFNAFINTVNPQTIYVRLQDNSDPTVFGTTTFDLIVNALPAQPTITSVSPTCSSDGTSTISNYDGTLTYTFSPVGPTVGAGGLVSGMVVGTSYTVIADNGSCSSIASASFSNSLILASPVQPTISSVAPTCSSDGSSSISNYDGTLTYTFSPVGPTVGAGGAITGMVVGTNYTVISNNGNCDSAVSASFSNAATLTTPAQPTITSVSPTCSSDGTSTISNYDGTLTYAFSPVGPTVGAGGLVSGMVVGTSYTVIADNGSCSSIASASFSNSLILAS